MSSKKKKFWYNGYQFSAEPVKVYNPYSIAYLFRAIDSKTIGLSQERQHF